MDVGTDYINGFDHIMKDACGTGSRVPEINDPTVCGWTRENSGFVIDVVRTLGLGSGTEIRSVVPEKNRGRGHW